MFVRFQHVITGEERTEPNVIRVKFEDWDDDDYVPEYHVMRADGMDAWIDADHYVITEIGV